MSDEIRLELDEQQEDICFELDGPPVPGKTGNGIASIVMNPDYTLTINYTDGTSYTTPSIRGEEGNGISNITVNSDYSLTIHMDDGSSYTTPPVRGPQGEDGVGIQSIEKTGSSDLVDTYTITMTDGSTTTFTVTNGIDGQDGFSPTITVTNITGGHRLTITDKNGTRTVDVMDGAQGDPGFSPTVTVTDITGGHRVTITDSTGSHSFDVMDGTDAHITVDSALSDTSENPVQNKVINSALSDLTDEINHKSSVVDSDATGVDLDVSDEDGNVLVRFKNGEIQTKEFDSELAPTEKDSINRDSIDLDISDGNGNVIVRLENGQIRTKNFNSSVFNVWNEATYCSHGDSITWQDGKAYQQGQHAGEIARGYQTILKETLGLSSYSNYGQSGWSMALVNGNGCVNTIKSVADYSQYDFITISCGTNDFKLNVPIGTIGVIGDTTFDDTTFYGAYRDAVEYTLTNCPTVRIVLMTPLQRDNDGYDVNYTNSAGHKLIDYVNAVKAVGEMYALPVCDMYSNSGFTKKTLSTYTMDGLHPNDDGYIRMGGYLSRFVLNIGK